MRGKSRRFYEFLLKNVLIQEIIAIFATENF